MTARYSIPGMATCEPCGHPHGPLYVCPHYSPARKVKVQADGARMRAQLRDPVFRAEQSAKGIPGVVLDLIEVMGGGKPSGEP